MHSKGNLEVPVEEVDYKLLDPSGYHMDYELLRVHLMDPSKPSMLLREIDYVQ